MSLTRCLVAHHKEYLHALRRPPDARLRGLMSYCLLSENRQKEEAALVALQGEVVLMQAGYLRRVIEAGESDMAQIVSYFNTAEKGDLPALLERARKIHEATAQAVAMLQLIESTAKGEELKDETIGPVGGGREV